MLKLRERKLNVIKSDILFSSVSDKFYDHSAKKVL